MISEQLATLFAHLQHPLNRLAVANEIATYLEIRQMLVFVRDNDHAEYIPAPGFPPVVDDVDAWQSFLVSCQPFSICAHPLHDPLSGEEVPVCGMSDEGGGCVLAFLGGVPHEQKLRAMRLLLPFLNAKLVDEALLRAASMRHAGQDAQASDTTSDTAPDQKQFDLQLAYDRAERELIYRRDAENRLRAADRRKDEFIATVSHELRTPLNAMLGWAELLKLKVPADSSLVKAIDAIIRSAKTQATLINDLLDTSSIAAGKIVLYKEPLDLIDVLERARETVEPLAQQKKIQIQARYKDSIALQADSARLRQVFWNLLCNSIKFTPDGGTIAIDATTDAEAATVTITDSGVGIEGDFLPYVFDRFRQADATLRRKYGGLGLGLSIAKQFVEMHGGQVAVSSEGAGKGSVFTIQLPLEKSDSASSTGAQLASGKSALPNLDSVRILAVDDDPDAREVTARMLQRFGAVVTSTESALHALSLMEAREFDILLSDIAMPEMDGISFIEKVRERNPGGYRIPAIAITAFSDLARIKQAHASGFNLVLTKPLLAMELGQNVERLIAEKERQ